MTFFEFFKKMPKMILEVLTLRLFWGLKSLNFKTFKTQFLDLVLKVLTLRPPSWMRDRTKIVKLEMD